MTEYLDRHRYRVYMSGIEMFPYIWPTPLIKLNSLSDNGYEVFAKLESFNPFSHSIKDRPVWYMIKNALNRCIKCGKLYEATSGNVGIAMVSISNALGIKFKAYLPRPTPELTKTILKILGAEVIETNYETISEDMINMVEEEAIKDGAINLNQFINDDNFIAHLRCTAKELDEQLKMIGHSPPDVIIVGVGTSGHIAALAKYFKEKYHNVKIVGVTPAKGDSIPGIKRLETKPKWFFKVEIDNVIEISKIDAIKSAIDIARNEGILIGLSAGAVTKAYKIAKLEHGKGTYILIYPDDAFKYIEAFKKYLKSTEKP